MHALLPTTLQITGRSRLWRTCSMRVKAIKFCCWSARKRQTNSHSVDRAGGNDSHVHFRLLQKKLFCANVAGHFSDCVYSAYVIPCNFNQSIEPSCFNHETDCKQSQYQGDDTLRVVRRRLRIDIKDLARIVSSTSAIESGDCPRLNRAIHFKAGKRTILWPHSIELTRYRSRRTFDGNKGCNISDAHVKFS